MVNIGSVFVLTTSIIVGTSILEFMNSSSLGLVGRQGRQADL